MCDNTDIPAPADPADDFPELRYSETLDLFRDTIRSSYSAKNVEVYRSVSQIPPTPMDFVPTRRRGSEDGVQEEVIELTPGDVANLTEEEKNIEVGHNAISVHKTPQKGVSEAKRSIRRMESKYSPGRAEEAKALRKYIIKLNISPENGLISEFHPSTKHANFLPAKNVDVVGLWDQSFDPILIDYDENGSNSKNQS